MTYQEIADIIKGIGLPYAYDHFKEGLPDEPVPAPPFICFYFPYSNDMAADDVNYQRIRPLTLELYTDNKDFSLEETVEAALNGAGLVYSREETYIDSERMYMVTFSAEIIITEGE